MSLVLCGFPISNYHNQVKLQLLEKGVTFEERMVMVADVDRNDSPMGKVPFLLTPKGSITESAVMMEYIEETYPDHPLVPSDPFEAAKVRELNTYLCLHVELTARQLYPEAFFKQTVSDATKDLVKKQLSKSLKALMSLAKFSPYVAGDSMSIADCSAIYHFPLVSMATKAIYGEDMLAQYPQVSEYLAFINERPFAKKVKEDRAAFQKLMAAK